VSHTVTQLESARRAAAEWVPHASEAEIESNTAILRNAKRAAGRELTLVELDALLPAVPCRRTRAREKALREGRVYIELQRGDRP
jgi:hypothetical protein